MCNKSLCWALRCRKAVDVFTLLKALANPGLLKGFWPPCGRRAQSRFVFEGHFTGFHYAAEKSYRWHPLAESPTRSCLFSLNPFWHFLPSLNHLRGKENPPKTKQNPPRLTLNISCQDKTNPFRKYFHETFIPESLKFNVMGKHEWNLYVISANYFFNYERWPARLLVGSVTSCFIRQDAKIRK